MESASPIDFAKVVPGRLLICRFKPLAWINDQAVEIDGATDFDATLAYLALSIDDRERTFETLRLGSAEFLRPAWLMPEHGGPFNIDVEAAIRAFHGSHAEYNVFIASLPNGFLEREAPEPTETTTQFTLVLRGVTSGAIIEDLLRALADSDDIVSVCGMTICGEGDGDVVDDTEIPARMYGTWRVEEVAVGAEAGDAHSGDRGGIHAAGNALAQHGVRRRVPDHIPIACAICVHYDATRTPLEAVALMHGEPACEECIAWHTGDPHNADDETCGSHFEKCLSALPFALEDAS